MLLTTGIRGGVVRLGYLGSRPAVVVRSVVRRTAAIATTKPSTPERPELMTHGRERC
jgi:hypothetical protein